MKKLQLDKQTVVILVGIIFAVSAVGLYFVSGGNNTDSQSKTQASTTPDQVFKNYLTKYVKSSTYAATDSYSGAGTTLQLKGQIEVPADKMLISGDADCTATVDGKPVNINASVTLNGADTYLRINSASGTVTNYQTRAVYNLQQVFQNAKGTWYQSVSDPAIQTMLDANVYVSTSSILAPSYDSGKIVDALLNNKVFTLSQQGQNGGEYTIKISANKASYLEALKTGLPELKDPDLVLDYLFEEQSAKESTLTLKEDGTLISEKLTQTNICTDLLESYIGEEYSGLAKDVSGTSEPKPIADVKIDAVTGAKPIADLQQDLRL